MKHVIPVMCAIFLTLAATAQETERVPAGPLNLSKIGNKEYLPGSLKRYSSDSVATARIVIKTTSELNETRNVVRIHSLKALCDPNSIIFSWTAIQQNSVERFEIEQSNDEGRTWTNIGITPATTSANHEAQYQFRYNKSLGNVQVRIAAINKTGEKIYSGGVQSPCSNTATLNVYPNPVQSMATVRIGSPAAARVRITLVNSSGAIVQVKESGLMEGQNNISIDMSTLPTGIYMVNIVWNGGKQDTLTVVKE